MQQVYEELEAQTGQDCLDQCLFDPEDQTFTETDAEFGRRLWIADELLVLHLRSPLPTEDMTAIAISVRSKRLKPIRLRMRHNVSRAELCEELYSRTYEDWSGWRITDLEDRAFVDTDDELSQRLHRVEGVWRIRFEPPLEGGCLGLDPGVKIKKPVGCGSGQCEPDQWKLQLGTLLEAWLNSYESCSVDGGLGLDPGGKDVAEELFSRQCGEDC